MTRRRSEATPTPPPDPTPLARSVAHATFHLERSYDASRARVWAALTDPGAKAEWFAAPSDKLEILERAMDVRPGGRERLRGRWSGGTVSTYDATYYDVIENERLIYCYEMHLDDRKISVSVATMQLQADGKRTRVLLTEQGAFLDGYDDAGARERGTAELLDALGRAVTG
ncbi:MAG: hypothetical protein BGO51_18490 [Rhodospirillales bacterium 69-11]|mgnify:CR=1 FL=1|nr:SRPBCC family protein [Rhodospirillales bacterium]MBN8930056.1 SRPBCC family protein [Rhodospirillales bacterium]OJW21766.1 MAG: hypothetical protein BGO51_18490 [Rhodospirillales bacterium 69-11]